MSQKSYKELLLLQQQIAAELQHARDVERPKAIEQILEIMKEFDISPEDIGGKRSRGKGVKAKRAAIPPKYRDSLGNEWSGRGKPPKWIADKNRDEFLIKQ